MCLRIYVMTFHMVADGGPIGWAECNGDFTSGAVWSDVTTRSDCGEVEMSVVSVAIENLTHIEVDDGFQIATSLKHLTKDPEVLVEQDILCTVLVLRRINSARPQNQEVCSPVNSAF